MIYLDSAAIVKLVHVEAESAELGAWLAERISMPRYTSVLAEVEVARAIRRHAPASLPGIPAVMGTIARFTVDDAVRALAASFPDATLRSLDAIHLATAMLLAAETRQQPVFVTYDRRLLAVAKSAGLTTANPGQVL